MQDFRARFRSTRNLWSVDAEGRCACGDPECARPGKHPAKNADGPGYVVETGRDTGIVVIDVDVKGRADGRQQLFELMKETRSDGRKGVGVDLPDTFMVLTPSGGWHFYFRYPAGEGRINGKLDTAIDIKGDRVDDDGFVYCVGPGVTTWNSHTKAHGVYAVLEDLPLAELPPEWVDALRLNGTGLREDTDVPTPISPEHEDYDHRIELGIQACTTMAPSQGDGMGGSNLFLLAQVLVRRLELPLDVARELIDTHFNPRCTNTSGGPWPWDAKDIDHKLEQAATRGQMAIGGVIPRAQVEDLTAMVAARVALPSSKGTPPDPTKPHTYEVEVGSTAQMTDLEKISVVAVARALSGRDAPVWKGVLRYDVLTDAVFAVRPPVKLDAEEECLSDHDGRAIQTWFACKHKATVPEETCFNWAASIAKKSPFNSLHEYFKSLPPSEGAIEELCDVLGAGDSVLSRVMVRKFLLSAVRRAMHPGCQVDTVLVLKGAPGTFKTSTVRALFGEKWVSESLPSLKDTKAVGEVIRGKWAIELAEMAEMFRVERDSAIAFITRTNDTFRAAYAKNAKSRPRMCVLVGTINGDEVYTDALGADVRRLWVLDVPKAIDIDKVIALRDRVWSEAFAATQDDVWHESRLVKGAPHWLTEEEMKMQVDRANTLQERDPWVAPISKFVIGKQEVSCEDVLEHLHPDALEKHTLVSSRRVGKILRQMGYPSKQVKRHGRNVKVFLVGKLPD